jgi:hypothetical protein
MIAESGTRTAGKPMPLCRRYVRLGLAGPCHLAIPVCKTARLNGQTSRRSACRACGFTRRLVSCKGIGGSPCGQS